MTRAVESGDADAGCGPGRCVDCGSTGTVQKSHDGYHWTECADCGGEVTEGGA